MIKVLIVEDDPMVVKFNKYYLEQVQGFELVAVAHSGKEALNILKNQKIDLVLLDIYMPGINGLDLLTKLRKMGEGADIIVVSAAHDSASIKRALQYGAVDYLIKPFEFDRFRAALIAYKEREKLIKSHEDLSQMELDKHFLSMEQASASYQIPKGLDKNTLKSTWESIMKMEETAFSTEEMAHIVGVSRVSMRKYVQFLDEIGILKMEINYGSLGRPVYRYIRIKKDVNFSVLF